MQKQKPLLIKMSGLMNDISQKNSELSSEAALQSCSKEKVFWKYAENLQENTRAEVLNPLDDEDFNSLALYFSIQK